MTEKISSEEDKPGQSSPGRIRRILIVDDEPMICQILEAMLKNDGYSVRSFGSPVKAVQCLSEERFDLAMLDFNMPEMNGITLAKNIKARCPETRILFMTGLLYADPFSADHGIKGCTILRKPFDLEKLREAINQLG